MSIALHLINSLSTLMLKTTIYFFLYVLTLPLLVAQEPKLFTFNESSGFHASRFLTDAQQDSDGFLWVTGMDGVFRYDGKTFQKFNIDVKRNLILRFKEQNGIKYFVDYNGKIFLLEKDTIIAYPHNHLIDSLKTSRIYRDTYFDDKGALHASFRKIGYCIIERDGTITKPMDSIIIRGVGPALVIKDQTLFSTLNLRENKKQKKDRIVLLDKEFNVLDSIKLKRGNHSPYCTVKIKDKFIYSDALSNIVTVDSDSISHHITYDFPINRMVVDSESNLWISSAGGGIHFYKDGIIDLKKREVILDSSGYTLASFDHEGGAWLISGTNGLAYIPNIYFRHFTTKEGLSTNEIKFVKAFDNQIYTGGNSNKINQLNEKSLEVSHLKELPIREIGQDVRTFYKNPYTNRKWAAIRGSVFYENNGKWKQILRDKYESGTNALISFYDLKKSAYRYSHAIVVKGLNDIFFMNDTQIVETINNPNIKGSIGNIIEYHKHFYVLTDKSFYLLKKDTLIDLYLKYPQLKRSVVQLKKFNNSIYVVTEKTGVFIIKQNELIPFEMIDIPNRNTIMAIVDSTELWFFDYKKTIKLSVDSSMQLSYNTYVPFPKFTNYLVAGTKSGFYSITYNEGLVFRPRTYLEQQKITPPELHQFSFKVNDTIFKRTDSSYVFNYDENFISFYFQLISYQQYAVNYRYRLKGLNKEWTFGNETQVQFVNLDAGVYQFEVQARKGEQIWSYPKTISFKINPPFWERWWFIALCILILSGSIYIVVNNKITTLQREKALIFSQLNARQKMLRAKMDPHFIFNIISSLQYFILKKENKLATQFLKKFSALMRGTLDQVDKDFISIGAEIQFLEKYIELEKFRQQDSFDYSIDIAPEINQNDLIPTFIIQPFIENAIHHGLKNKTEQGSLLLQFSRKAAYLIVVIQDNGMGFNYPENAYEQSHGISTTQERLKLYNGNEENEPIQIEEGSPGSKITLTIKLSHDESIDR